MIECENEHRNIGIISRRCWMFPPVSFSDTVNLRYIQLYAAGMGNLNAIAKMYKQDKYSPAINSYLVQTKICLIDGLQTWYSGLNLHTWRLQHWFSQNSLPDGLKKYCYPEMIDPMNEWINIFKSQTGQADDIQCLVYREWNFDSSQYKHYRNWCVQNAIRFILKK